MNKIVISISGGMDSSTLMGKFLNEGYEVYPVSFTYGSKHNKYENEACKNVCTHYGYNEIPIINLDFINQLFKSDLLSTGGKIPEGHYTDKNMVKTVVPGRNLIFASIVAGYAESIGANYIGLGVHAGDHHVYPDCRPKFIEKLNETIIESSEGKVTVLTPFLHMTKKDILEIGYGLNDEFKVPYHLTRTCYKDQVKSCGRCASCVERLEAFDLIGKRDPIIYHKESIFEKSINFLKKSLKTKKG